MKLPITSHFFLTRILTVLCCVALCCVTPACSSDEPDSNDIYNRSVKLKGNGKTSNDGNYSIDRDTITIDGIKYKYCNEDNHIKICGYDKTVSGTVIPYSTVYYNGTKYITTAVYRRAFSDLQADEIILPSSIMAISGGAFADCSSGLIDLSQCKIDGIAESAFYKANIKTLKLPSTITAVAIGAFKEFSTEELTIPESVVSIDAQAFFNAKIGKLILPQHLTSMHDAAFGHCTGVESVEFLGEIENIGQYAFINCESVRHVHFGPGVRQIGHESFYGCSNLESISFDNGIEIIGDSFSWSGLKGTLSLPESLIEISHFAFSNTKIETLIIPASVQKIGYGAFVRCDNLKTVVMKCPPPVTEDLWYYFLHEYYIKCNYSGSIGLPPLVKLYVPDEYIEQYRVHPCYRHIYEIFPLSQYQGQ